MSRYRLFAALLSAVALFVASAATADELQEISKLAKQGQHASALERVNSYISSHPKDAQARFLKGLILTEQNKTSEAIAIFTALSQDYPELPEPYNNLAVLYASQQQYEKARIALEMAIRTHPSYATAHENLGDIYAKLASMSYDKALQLDKGNASAQTKLSMIRDLFSPASRNNKAPSSAEPPKQPIVVATPPITKPVLAAPAKPAPAAAAQPAPVVPPAVATPAPAKAVEAPAISKPSLPAETKESKPAADNPEAAAVLNAVNQWAKSWSNSNVDAYLAAYAPDFKVPAGESRSKWEKTRKERLMQHKSIQVAVVAPEVKIESGSRAIVNFKQLYRSKSLKTSTRKMLVLVKSGSKWLIQEERVIH